MSFFPLEHFVLGSHPLCKPEGLRNKNIEMTKKPMSMTNSVVYFYMQTSMMSTKRLRWLSYPKVVSHPHRFITEIWQQRSGSRF